MGLREQLIATRKRAGLGQRELAEKLKKTSVPYIETEAQWPELVDAWAEACESSVMIRPKGLASEYESALADLAWVLAHEPDPVQRGIIEGQVALWAKQLRASGKTRAS